MEVVERLEMMGYRVRRPMGVMECRVRRSMGMVENKSSRALSSVAITKGEEENFNQVSDTTS